ncbi:hypothetical protein C1H76_6490 [Elsinoe australis]|uniref:KANL3/Tex30 alpha/beta hydrolase-like domain-containing protein n=1 Tax=Elsinoe australis TaxID=40998 RepID=A0A4U7AY61_9PEZI|nr:hypothetical protein C1H76_6490 [Elsinoe australis]
MASRRSKRKHDDSAEQQKNTEEGEDDSVDLSKSVLGGMKGGWRLNGDEDKDQGIETSKLPFGEKFIICQRYKGPPDSQAGNDPTLIFTHGAGGGIANPATTEFAKGYASESPVLCFQGTMNLQNRVKCFKTVLEDSQGVTALGGRSMGARAATITATEHADIIQCLVLVSFPLTSERGGDSREDILLNIPEHIDVLFVIGDGDKMCHLGNLRRVRQRMKATSWSVVVEGADHSMSLKDKRGVSAMRAKTGQIAAQWRSQRDDNNNEAIVSWNGETSEVEVSDWRRGPIQSRASRGASDKDRQDEPQPPRKRQRKKP